MKLYTIIGGVNGCGKSSLTSALKAERDDLGTIIDPGKISAQLGSNVAGSRATIEKIDHCLAKGLNFTQETTLAGARTERTIRRAKELGYTIRLYYVGLDSLGESLSRIENRVRKGGHSIPSQDVERRYHSRFRDLLRVLPYCDEGRLLDNENGFAEVAIYKNGELLPITQTPPQWLVDLMTELGQ